ncbi:hypothetical protein VTH8203_03378 [Vibrio thalassae]|uniref:Uncharacterized protein n=1 Tax=Vibrio thalassae TaxID=1243014 RepID=A0A240EP22_9VIBR|nr:hypothetical protein [Vibrio thalassae]SNX49730.1 hypothetical protein VTH8203_03378 [Vibrio thalassae]
MSLCNFSQPQHFLRGLSNGADLSAFALGAENSYVHFRLQQDGPIPSSPELQNTLEDLAAYLLYFKIGK